MVILTRVLPTEDTIGYEDLHTLVVTKINGLALQSLADISAALAQAKDGVHRVEFDGEPGVIFLDATRVAASEDVLMKKYRLPAVKRLD